MDFDNAQLSAYLTTPRNSKIQDARSMALLGASARVSTLPTEILREIFKIVASQYPLWGLKFVSQVCRRWRDVAIGDSFLWVKPRRHHGPTFFEIMLERSRSADLDILVDDRMPEKMVEAALGCMARIALLEVTYGEVERSQQLQRPERSDLMSVTMSLILDCLTGPGARLKVLKIRCDSTRCKENTVALFRRLQPMEQLTRLTLTGAYFDWSIFPLPNLEHLDLRLTGVSEPIPMDEFLKILQQMRRLETMVLSPALRVEVISPLSASSVKMTSQHKVSLPRLQYLEFHSKKFNTCLSLLLHTDLPRLCRMVLDVGGHRGHITDGTYYTLPRAIADKITNGNFDVFNICRLKSDYSLILESGMDCSSSHSRAASLTNIDPAAAIPSSVEFKLSDGLWDWNSIGPSLSAALFRDLAVDARMSMDDVVVGSRMTTDDFTQFLEKPCFSSMKRLTVYNPAPYISAMSWIFAAILPQGSGDHQFVPFPDLEMIRLEGDWLRTVTPLAFKRFCDCLASRRSAGFSLKKLDIRAHDATPEQLSSLKKGVIELDYSRRYN